MSQNHHLPSSDCAAFAPLLPLAAHHLLSESEDARLRTHLASCAHCRSELRIYDAVEEALRRSFAPRQGAWPPFSREELMQTLDHQSDQPIDQPVPAPSAPPIVPATPPRGARRFLAGIPALAAVLAVVLIAAVLFAAQFHGNIAGSANVTPAPVRGSDTELHDISMVSPTEGWAVGYATPADDPNTPTAVLMHYARGIWSRIHTTIQGRIKSISMVSASNGWAVSEDGVMLHYDGKTWKQSAGVAGSLHRVQMVSATDGWAIGDGYDPTKATGIWHYDGQAWTPQPLPASLNLGFEKNTLELFGLSMLSASDGWAVGYLIFPSTESYPTIPPSSVILHYTGGHWIIDSTIKGASLQSISMASTDDGWAAGHTDTYTPSNAGGTPGTTDSITGLLLHYTGGQWTRVANPLATPSGKYEGSLLEVVLDAPADGWLVGEALIDTPGLLHYNGTDWTPVSLPAASTFKGDTRFYTIASIAIVSTTEAWAVGYKFSTAAGGIPNPQGYGYQPTVTPVILHYHQGAWSIYPD
jgi:hypothetical protein